MMCSAVVMSGCGKKATFMYFVSESDENYEEEMEVYESLEKKYSRKVVFDLHNIDETPEDKENFPVDGTTPVLIMLDVNNDISAMEFMCSDEDTLKADIEKALSVEKASESDED